MCLHFRFRGGGYRDRPPRGYGDRYDDSRGYSRGRDDRRGGYSGGDGRQPLAERPRLQLQPRSKDLDSPKEEQSQGPSSIFGGARPVDTAAKELEVEERLKREDEDREKERREVSGVGKEGRCVLLTGFEISKPSVGISSDLVSGSVQTWYQDQFRPGVGVRANTEGTSQHMEFVCM